MQRLAVDAPADAALVVALVVYREARLLKCLEVATDGPRGDLELGCQAIDGRTMARRLEGMEQAPLADDFLVSRHATSSYA